jgi:hypothetical protein
MKIFRRKIKQSEDDWIKDYAKKEAESIIRNHRYVSDVEDIDKLTSSHFWGYKNKEKSVAYKHWGLKYKLK